MDLKSFIKSQTALKAVARWLLQPSHDFRPRWWVRVFVNPFVHRISRKAIRRWSARLDVVPFQAFSVGPYSILESQSLISNACGAVILGEKVLLGVGSVVIGPAVLDNNILIAQNVVISALNHDFEDVSRPIMAQGYSVKTVHIETGVWIGAGAVVTQGVRIGQNAVVGAGSVVTKDVPPFSVVVGNPARLVKQYNPKTGIWEKIN